MTDYVANIRSIRARATAQNVSDGKAWYPGMVAIMRQHSVETGLTTEECAAVYAACSINTKWDRNVALASGALADYAAGREAFATGGTLIMHIEKVFGIFTGTLTVDTLVADPDNHKIRSFTRNLSGDTWSVTVDRWAFRVATMFADCPNNGDPCKANGRHGCGKVPTGEEYQTIADAYRTVAAEYGETPADLQAITWIVVRGKGD